MSNIFGVSANLILAALAGTTALVILLLVLSAGRGFILLRLGYRNVPRRPFRTVLVTVGLAVSTAVLTSALATGDTMTYNIRSLVTTTIGRVDEMVVLSRRAPQRIGPEDLAQIVSGQLVSGARSYFPSQQALRVQLAVENNPVIAGVLPAIIEPMVAANPSSQTVGSSLNVIGLPDQVPEVFGLFPDSDGRPSPIGSLEENEIYLNALAASQLAATPGDPIILYFGNETITPTVKTIVDTSSMGAEQPAVLIKLADLQSLVKRDNQVNRVLVANSGDSVTSVEQTEAALLALRQVLVREEPARVIWEILHSDFAQSSMTRAKERLTGVQREKLDKLQLEAQNDTLTPEFKSMIGDPEVIGRIAFVASSMRGTSQANSLNRALNDVNILTVIDIKRAALNRAEDYGSVLTSIFLVVGLLSIVAALALVFLVFLLLTAERRSEMGVLRAIGMRGNQLITTFLFEGLIYDLIGALIGVSIGVAAGILAFQFVSGLLVDYGVEIIPNFSPRSMAIAYLAGVLLTLLSVGGAAWRIARLNIVAAIRDLPDSHEAGLAATFRAARGWVGLRSVWHAVIGVLGVSGVGALVVGFAVRQTGLAFSSWGWFLLGITLMIIGAGQLIGFPFRTRWTLIRTVVLSAAAVLVLLLWLEETDLLGFAQWPFNYPDYSAYALRGLVIVLAGVWLAALNVRVLLLALTFVVSPFRPLVPALRLAATYPAIRPWRTGFAMAMFSMVIFTMTLASVLLNVALYAYGDPSKGQLGYDIRAEPTASGAPPDIRSGFSTATAIKSSDFLAIGTLLSTPLDTLDLSASAAGWRSGTINLLDDEMVGNIPLRLLDWDKALGDSADAWNLFATDPGTALISNRGIVQTATPAAFVPYTVWLRNPEGGTPVRLRVIGIIDSEAGIPAGVVVPVGHVTVATPEVRAYFLKVAPGIRPEDASLGLNLSFGEAGLRTSIVGQEFQRASAIRTILTYLLEVFLGLGLIAGLSALGVLGVMAVVERRGQIGILRAIGYRRWMVVAAFTIESAFIALMGILVGAVSGIVVARALTLDLARSRAEIVFVMPWNELGLILGVAAAAALVMAAIPAQQAGGIRPAEAIRST